MKLKDFFSQKELDAIQDSVKSAESKTSGEIVPFFAESSDEYSSAYFLVGILGFILSFTFYGILDSFQFFWRDVEIFEIFTISLVVGICFSLFLKLFPSAKRYFITKSAINHYTLLSAESIFLKEGIFQTKERTGILIYISLLEHKVRIIADQGIHSKLVDSDYAEMIHCIIDGIKTNKRGEGIVKAIHLCGDLLQKNGFSRKLDDEDELSNELRSK